MLFNCQRWGMEVKCAGGINIDNLDGKPDILSQRIAKNQKDIFSYPLYWRNHGKNSSKRNTGVTDFD